MVVESNRFYITPMPVSAARAATAEGSSDWVGDWLLDLATHYPAFALDAEQHADGLNLMGYTTTSSLAYMHDNTAVREIQDALGLNLIMDSTSSWQNSSPWKVVPSILVMSSLTDN